MIWVYAYLACGVFLVVHGALSRGLYIEHLRARPVTLLKRGGPNKHVENYRGYGEFVVTVLIVVIGWLPLFAFGGFMRWDANRHARAYERERDSQG